MRQMGRSSIGPLCAALAAPVVAAPTAGAASLPAKPQPGALDRSFSGDGKITGRATGVPTRSYWFERDDASLALGPRGEIAVARETTIAEYLPNGHLRREFGTGGRLTIGAAAGQQFRLTAIAIDSRSRLVVAGITTPSPWQHMTPPDGMVRGPFPARATVIRYSNRGRPDPSFGQDGISITDLGLPYPYSSQSFGLPTYTYPEPSVFVSPSSSTPRTAR